MNPERLALETDWGTVEILLRGERVAACHLPPVGEPPPAPAPRIQFLPEHPAARFAADLLEGRRPKELPPLFPPPGTPFQRRVWTALSRIPYGEVWTYGRLAREIDRPKAVRAVAAACGKNPLPLFLPCHRVVSANGLGGFTPGLPWKRHLLAIEARASGRPFPPPPA